MSARVFIHPVCTAGLPASTLAINLQNHGFDMEHKYLMYYAPRVRKHKVFELVKFMEANDMGTLYERMDGTQFLHPAPSGAEAA